MILEQILDRCEVIQAGIVTALLLEGFRITDGTARGEGRTIGESHHAIDVNPAANRWPVEGLQQRVRQCQTACFHNNAVQLVSAFQQTLDGRQEIVLNRAAETTVVELNKTTIQLLFRTEAAAANQIAIEADTSEFIDHDGQSLTAVDEQMSQHGRFACPQKSGDHSHR